MPRMTPAIRAKISTNYSTNLAAGVRDANIWLSGIYTEANQATDPYWIKRFASGNVSEADMKLFSRSLTLGQVRADRANRIDIADLVNRTLINPPPIDSSLLALSRVVECLAEGIGEIVNPGNPSRQINWASAVTVLAWPHLRLFIDTPNTREAVATWEDGEKLTETIEQRAEEGDYHHFLLSCYDYMEVMMSRPSFKAELVTVTARATDRQEVQSAFASPTFSAHAQDFIARRLFDKVAWHEGKMLR